MPPGVGGPTEPIEDSHPNPYDAGFEMMFDGAQCVRLGKDIVANVSTANHALAVDWLERHLAGVFDLAFAPAPGAIVDELRPATV